MVIWSDFGNWIWPENLSATSLSWVKTLIYIDKIIQSVEAVLPLPISTGIQAKVYLFHRQTLECSSFYIYVLVKSVKSEKYKH